MILQAFIVNADDFGLTESCTNAIAEAFRQELISSTTACANGEAIEAAYRIATQNGFVNRVGIHINLTEGKPLTAGIAADPFFCADGVFHNQIDRLKKPGRESLANLRAEVTAQIERLRAVGFPLSHADSHHHIHTGVFLEETIAAVLLEQGIAKLRLHRNLGAIPFYKKIVKNRYNKKLHKQGFVTTQKMGSLADLKAVPAVARRYLTEIMVHPDFDAQGALIDRAEYQNGNPTGELLCTIAPFLQNETLLSYGDL